ncbi:hypothetical protein FRB96_000951 [Tulasnella sp. 330]|nr:hypothetical protein FRB96_000951 [Tulasnella sp. 330]KAG8880415.1 hypothetical protein FRB98_005137 [Tulasnella sp. 332]
MPFDPSVHLASQGWGGLGEPLRPNSNGLRKPIILSQKKTLGGVGKDRDISFAFWDHVYAASSQAITIKIHNDSDTEDETSSASASAQEAGPSTLNRTQTGILSNRPPPIGEAVTPSSSGDCTPTLPSLATNDFGRRPHQPRSLLSLAKKEAAKRGLYARFFRGPIVSPPPDHDLPAEPAPQEAGSLTKRAVIPEDDGGSQTAERSTVDNAIVDEKALEATRKVEKAARKEKRAERRLKKAERKLRRLEKARNKGRATTGTIASPSKPPQTTQIAGLDDDLPLSTLSPSKKRKASDIDNDEMAMTNVTDNMGAEAKQDRKRRKKSRGGREETEDAGATAKDKRSDRSDRKAERKAERRKEMARSEKRVKFAPTIEQVVVSRWLS